MEGDGSAAALRLRYSSTQRNPASGGAKIKPNGRRLSTPAIAPAFSAERIAAWRSIPPARRVMEALASAWILLDGEMLDGEKLGESLGGTTSGAQTPALEMMESEEDPRPEKRICGIPQPEQKGELSSTAAPHPWQRCSTGLDYLRQARPRNPDGAKLCLLCPSCARKPERNPTPCPPE